MFEADLVEPADAVVSDGPAWSGYAPDGLLATVLAEQSGGSEFERLERIGAWEKLIAWAQAHQVREIADYLGSTTEDVESATAEVGCMLRVAARTAAARVGTAVDVSRRLPAVRAALAAGEISLPAARILADETTHLPVREARSVADAVLDRAGEQTPGQLRAAVRRAVLRADPDAVQRRCEQATRQRGVWLQDEPDGMATLYARLPAADAVGCYAVLDEYARRASGPDRPGMDARRADTLVDLICGADPGRVTVQVRVAVPAGTLLGIDDTPGELAGYGAIPADAARRIAAEGTWRRLLTDPASGGLLDVGMTRYKPPQSLAEHVITRDQTCRGPGCRVPAHRCDLDHTEPFNPEAGTGPTSEHNLGPECRTHHQLKQRPGWNLTQAGDGTFTWRTPSGHTYTTRPPPLE